MKKEALLSEKVSIITGGASGIGQATALVFAREGARVIIADINFEAGRAAAKQCNEISNLGHTYVETDVLDKTSVVKLADSVLEESKRIDILINCAGGFSQGRETVDIPEEEWDYIIDLNLKSAFLCCQAVIPSMKNQRYGRIVNLSSDSGRSAITLSASHYAAAKAAILGFTRHLARELGPYNIYVNAVAPGTTLTERIEKVRSEEFKKMAAGFSPLGRLAEVGEQAEAILFLASDRASYITGATLDVSGGRIMF